MLREQVPVGGDRALPSGGGNWRGCLPKTIGAGLAVGFLTGLFGVGGGFLIIPALVRWPVEFNRVQSGDTPRSVRASGDLPCNT